MRDTAGLDMRDQIARIDRAITDTHRFQAEPDKPFQEATKPQRARVFMPWQAVATFVRASAAPFAPGAGIVILTGG